MSSVLTPKSPLIYPSTISVPVDSDSLLWSGPVLKTLTDLADRTDYLAGRCKAFAFSGTNSTGTSSTSYVDVTGATVSIGTLAIGDKVQVTSFCEADSSNVTSRIVVADTVDTTAGTSSLISSAVSPYTRLEVWTYVATRATAHTVKLQHKVSSGTYKATTYSCNVMLVRLP